MSQSSSLHSLVEGKIDFAGQQLVEQIAKVVLIASTVIAFVLGFALQSLTVTFGTFGASTIFLALLVIPPWPMFNRHPVKWLPVIENQSTKPQ